MGTHSGGSLRRHSRETPHADHLFWTLSGGPHHGDHIAGASSWDHIRDHLKELSQHNHLRGTPPWESPQSDHPSCPPEGTAHGPNLGHQRATSGRLLRGTRSRIPPGRPLRHIPSGCPLGPTLGDTRQRKTLVQAHLGGRFIDTSCGQPQGEPLRGSHHVNPLMGTPSEGRLIQTLNETSSRGPPQEEIVRGTPSCGKPKVNPRWGPRKVTALGAPMRDPIRGTNSVGPPQGDLLQDHQIGTPTG
jgi:hypothetical protein